jgi:hypothetical protein
VTFTDIKTYFQANRSQRAALPWEAAPPLTPAERRAVSTQQPGGALVLRGESELMPAKAPKTEIPASPSQLVSMPQ